MILAGDIARGGAVGGGWVEVADGRIVACGDGRPPRAPDEVAGGLLAPGLVDLQVNGAAGVEVTGGHGALDRIEAALLAHGVTSYLPTLVTAPDAELAAAAAVLAERVADPASPAAGIHVEGPFLARAHAGVHRTELLRAPADGPPPEIYSSPAVRLVTLAPELPGALELIADLRGRGVAVSLGHSGAGAETAAAAFAAGASMVTHLFNAMGPLHHRAPGLAGAALADPAVALGLIADGHHVDPLLLRIVARAAGSRVVLVSDASPAAAAPAGARVTLGGVPVVVEDGAPPRTPVGVLAGSAILLDDAVRVWAREAGAGLPAALAAASETPAHVLGMPPPLTPGGPADLVEVDADGRVVRTMRRGRWL